MRIEMQWLPVVGYEGYYEVSNTGMVKASKRSGTPGGVIKTRTSRGYNRVILSVNNKRKNFSIHRLVASAFINNPNSYKVVNHKDGNKTNNNVENLEWCDSKWNCLHSTRILRKGIGETNGRAKLTQREVDFLRYIKTNYNNISSKVVADFFDMSDTSILDIWNYKNWSN